MIEQTDEVKKMLKGMSPEKKERILKDAWEACCDGECLAQLYGEIDHDPWDGKHEDDRKRIELDMVEAVMDIHKDEEEDSNDETSSTL